MNSQIADHPTNPDLKLVYLANQKGIAVIDAKYADEVENYSWRRLRRPHTTYAYASVGKSCIYLHRLVADLAGIDLSADIDHRNHNGLDCTVDNLRPATRTQNLGNTRRGVTNKSGYKGVSWRSINKKWVAQISINDRTTYLGLFNDPEDAARAYDAAAIQHFGEFAFLNFPKVAA